jgi:hypothetical protein
MLVSILNVLILHSWYSTITLALRTLKQEDHKFEVSQAPLISILRKQGQMDLCEFKASLMYTERVSSKTARATE